MIKGKTCVAALSAYLSLFTPEEKNVSKESTFQAWRRVQYGINIRLMMSLYKYFAASNAHMKSRWSHSGNVMCPRRLAAGRWFKSHSMSSPSARLSFPPEYTITGTCRSSGWYRGGVVCLTRNCSAVSIGVGVNNLFVIMPYNKILHTKCVLKNVSLECLFLFKKTFSVL